MEGFERIKKSWEKGGKGVVWEVEDQGGGLVSECFMFSVFPALIVVKSSSHYHRYGIGVLLC